ncbi:MAG: TonB-dependent receptor [Bacteroidales bacterium]|nr:TonB-dependent receptor [Bacteroidales bacterium]
MRFTILLAVSLLSFLITIIGSSHAQTNRYSLSGFVYEAGSRESLPGVNIYFPEQRTGTSSNNYGFYSITLPEGNYQVVYSSVGYNPQAFEIELNKHITFDAFLDPSIELSGVEIVGERVPAITETPMMSTIDLPVKQIQRIPALLGEKDVLKIIQLMPGVKKGTEGSSGFYVRGGGADQNLIILDDATVYNAFHLFGFFSLFNGDALKSVQLTKGGFPARFGGRLSSVLEMTMKDGNQERISGEAGIGIISSRLLLEGPIIKNKASFIVSGRRTYLDVLARPFMPKDEKFGYYFYDLNAKVNYTINNKNRLYLSAYAGRDKFFARFKDFYSTNDAGMYWENATATLRWNNLINHRLFANASLIFSQYRLNIYVKEKYDNNWFELSYASGIRDLSLKYDLHYSPHPNHTIKAGLISTFHHFTPSAVVLRDDYLLEYEENVKAIDVLESGLYIEDEIKLGSKIRANAGMRLSHFVDKDASYINPEPRVSLSYLLPKEIAIKASFATMNQYVHVLSNTGIGLPTDLWVPSTKNVPPQKSRQVALGFAKDLKDQNLEVSIEGYYKKSDNTLGYREGASFLLIGDPTGAEEVNWENEVTSGQAWAYGAELLIQRKTGKLTGWIGYTLSWAELQFDEVNFGKKYFARYDRRHDISVVAVYEISEKLIFSGTWVYGTGNAITLPIGEYWSYPHSMGQYDGFNPGFWWGNVNDYGGINNFRMAPYHRLDLGIQFIQQYENWRGTWELSAYNAYNRKNPFFYYIGYTGADERALMQVSIFPIIPSLSYSIKF